MHQSQNGMNKEASWIEREKSSPPSVFKKILFEQGIIRDTLTNWALFLSFLFLFLAGGGPSFRWGDWANAFVPFSPLHILGTQQKKMNGPRLHFSSFVVHSSGTRKSASYDVRRGEKVPPQEKTPLVVVFPSSAISHFPFSPVLELSQRGKKNSGGNSGHRLDMGEGIQLQLRLPKVIG